ncbi:MAG TPA: signal peptide peptidase SppA [Vicinamibacteria bacterium]|nr:signal peptide peptidase SppA [Vicinamibacteria bacterium]
MKKRTAWILVAGVAAVAIGAAAVGALALLLRGSRGRSPFGGSESYLALNLTGEVPEMPGSEFGNFFETSAPSLRALVESLDRAATDPKVKAVVLRVSVLPDSGWGKVQELRDAITRFRKSGKPAYAHLEFCGNKEYYLATACNKVYAVPGALLDVSGLRAEVTFLRKTLDKLGVEAQFEGVGKYKNAPNQFTESSFTEPHREQTQALLDGLFDQYLAAISAARGKSVAEVRAAVDEGPYTAEDARAAGLVDELLYQDELDARLKSAERVTPGRYVRSARGFGFDSRPKVALVYAVGEIVSGESQASGLGGEFAGSDTVARAIRQARTDPAIRAIVLRVDSPGGSGTASDVIWREMGLARKAKPVVVSMGDVAASGGYYIAMGGDAIVAQPGTITGSIGVFGGKFSLRGLYDKIGVTKEILTHGRNAALFSEYRPWNEEERGKVRSLMVSFYETFVTKAAQGRHKTYEEVDRIAQGRVWTGAAALKVGLVDRLGGLDVAVAVAKERAKLGKDEDVALVVLPQRKGFFEALMERQEENVAEKVLPADVRSVVRWMSSLNGAGPIARLPFELSVR